LFRSKAEVVSSNLAGSANSINQLVKTRVRPLRQSEANRKPERPSRTTPEAHRSRGAAPPATRGTERPIPIPNEHCARSSALVTMVLLSSRQSAIGDLRVAGECDRLADILGDRPVSVGDKGEPPGPIAPHAASMLPPG